MNKKFLRHGIFILLALLVAGRPALADSDSDRARQLREAGEILPLETILHNLKKIRSGKVLEVELENHRGQLIYEIELLDDDGKVWEFKVNARNGELIQQKEEH